MGDRSYKPDERLLLLSARPAVISPAAERRRPLAGTKLYWLVTEAHVCKQLAQGCIRQRGGRDSNLRLVDRKFGSLTTQPPSHITHPIPPKNFIKIRRYLIYKGKCNFLG